MPVGRPGVSHDSAGPSLRNVQPRADRVHGRASPGRAQKFPEATSLSIALSRAWSATSFSSLRFSCSSAFNRLAWSRRKPPYSFRQREYVCSLIPSFLIYRKIKISFLQHLGPRGTSSAHRPTELVGNDRDARRCRACGCIDTDSSACPHPPPPPNLYGTRAVTVRPPSRAFSRNSFSERSFECR